MSYRLIMLGSFMTLGSPFSAVLFLFVILLIMDSYRTTWEDSSHRRKKFLICILIIWWIAIPHLIGFNVCEYFLLMIMRKVFPEQGSTPVKKGVNQENWKDYMR